MLNQRNSATYAENGMQCRTSASISCRSKLNAHRSKLIARSRSGLSLIEVLASIGVISIGLLGLASLLPVGMMTIFQATKADRAGNCGRAAMRDVIVRRMLEKNYWYDAAKSQFVTNQNYNVNKPWYDSNGNPYAQNMPASFIIDPLGENNGVTSTLGNIGSGVVPRITLNYVASSGTLADAIFRAGDDIITTLPENMKPAQPPGRPVPIMSNNKIQSQGDYSWFLSVTPDRNNPTRFMVSVVVCYRRTLNPTAGQVAEQAFPVKTFTDAITPTNAGTVALAGGTVQLTTPMTNGALGGITLRENNWVALVSVPPPNGNASASAAYCQWYRIAALGDNSDPTQGAWLTLAGPDWNLPPQNKNYLVVVGEEVVGVYTTTIDLDTDATWMN
jgi:Tfp pilus assembly protein PilV